MTRTYGAIKEVYITGQGWVAYNSQPLNTMVMLNVSYDAYNENGEVINSGTEDFSWERWVRLQGININAKTAMETLQVLTDSEVDEMLTNHYNSSNITVENTDTMETTLLTKLNQCKNNGKNPEELYSIYHNHCVCYYKSGEPVKHTLTLAKKSTEYQLLLWEISDMFLIPYQYGLYHIYNNGNCTKYLQLKDLRKLIVNPNPESIEKAFAEGNTLQGFIQAGIESERKILENYTNGKINRMLRGKH